MTVQRSPLRHVLKLRFRPQSHLGCVSTSGKKQAHYHANAFPLIDFCGEAKPHHKNHLFSLHEVEIYRSPVILTCIEIPDLRIQQYVSE